ncbi:hypothetical protein [Streptomyces murinus]|uniref:hypothetical protein n=1 Tax=Streptomyces murinus TaxID=33900 RepID=UPI002E0F2F58|nr:hypothetical protein OG516_01245 [Streptomyces murinus]
MNKIKAAPVAPTIALGGLGIAAAPAQADTCKLMGKTYNHGCTVTSEPLPNGTEQVFAIGTDGTPWHRTRSVGGTWSPWSLPTCPEPDYNASC